jgi:hypothetical protein
MQAGSSSGGGRTSAAVTQDTDKRSSAGKASSNDKLDLVSLAALQHNHFIIPALAGAMLHSSKARCVLRQLVLIALSCVYAL